MQEDYELEQQYCDMLDELYPPYLIGSSEFYASTILKECDPIMYKEGFADFVDSMNSW